MNPVVLWLWFTGVLCVVTVASLLHVKLRLVNSKLDLMDQKIEELLMKLDNMAPASSTQVTSSR
jgi:hypothetical protein